ncbi:MAG: flagellar type III secretion system pore protein FliP [Planctomycetes bacterium]|nr:flagellar type III secretion system pore protein FliP [Planctomycetota bacterium]
MTRPAAILWAAILLILISACAVRAQETPPVGESLGPDGTQQPDTAPSEASPQGEAGPKGGPSDLAPITSQGLPSLPEEDEGGGGPLELTLDGDETSSAMKVALGLTLLSLIPGLLLTATCFARILIVLGFLRVGLQVPNLPPTQVLVGLAFFLSLLAMQPTLEPIQRDALEPFVNDEIGIKEAFSRAEGPWRRYLLDHTRRSSLESFVDLAGIEVATPEETPLRVLVPAFVVSELTTAFSMGAVILIPFLVIDLVVASVLLSMNMIMLPPATVSVPAKVLLFVSIDGWQVLAETLVKSAL